MQYFIGVQLDGSQHVEPLSNCIPDDTAKESEKLVCTFFNCFLLSLSYYAFGFLCGVKLMSMSVYSE